MPLLAPDVVAAGTFRGAAQPTIPVRSGLLLRPWASRDAQAVFEAFADPEIRRWHVRTATCRAEVEGWIDSWNADWRGGAHAHWAVADAVTDDLLGRVSLKSMDLVCGQGGVAYWTMPARRRQDVASRAVDALDTVGVRRRRVPPVGTDTLCAQSAVVPGRHQNRLRFRRRQASRGAASRRLARHASTRSHQRH